MGIKSLSKFLKDRYPELFEMIHLSEYAYKKVAIDVSLYMYRYKSAYGDLMKFDKYDWLRAFIRLVACLRENELHCVFIYDTGAPKEKEAERKKRSDEKVKKENKIYELEQAIEKYHETNVIDPILLQLQDKDKNKPLMLIRQPFNIKIAERELSRLKSQLITVTPDDFALTKKVFDILQVPYFNAPVEAETMCADLCKQGKVDAVLSEDTDVLCYGAPIFLTKIDTSNSTCLRIDYNELLRQMNFTPDQFTDFCIMCGTDYNDNVFKVGPNKAFALIDQYGNIENVAEHTNLDISILNHVRVRELFKDYERSNVKVEYCGFPDFNALRELLFVKQIRMDTELLKKSFVRSIVIVDSDTESAFDYEESTSVKIDEDDEVIEI